MADRNIRTPSEALAQRLNKIEERVRALQLRAWPGAVQTRTMENVTVTSPGTTDVPASWNALVPVSVNAGRWVVFGHTQLVVPPPNVGTYNLQVALWATDEDGVVVSEGNRDYNFHTRVEYQSGVSTSTSIYRTMEIIGHFVSEVPVTVMLMANNFSGDEFSATESSLLLLPV